jgi:UDP-glucose 4-epimerase
VLEAVAAFEAACDKKIPVRFSSRRPGDVASCYASPESARELLGWRAEKQLTEMCADHWRWQRNHPNGY